MSWDISETDLGDTSFDIPVDGYDDFDLGDVPEASTDLPWSSPEILNLSDITGSTSSFSFIDLLEEKKTATRNGLDTLMSSVSQFTSILARTGIHGPKRFEAIALKERAVRIGRGSQYTVFKDRLNSLGFKGIIEEEDEIVIKRVNLPLSRDDGKSYSTGLDYRRQLRALELEVLALCNPAIRGHRNIVNLLAWGYDYPEPDTPVPVLVVEAALMTLTDFLQSETFGSMKTQKVDIRYHFALDVAAGLEAMHNFRIVHGDMKPDNILVFRQENPKVPFCAKLSDFGVCIDMQAPGSVLGIDDYRGTPIWLAPEVRHYDEAKYGPFNPTMMLHFDAYSFGLVVLSIFTNRGEPFGFLLETHDAEEILELAIDRLRSERSVSVSLRMPLSRALRGLLAESPLERPLPNTALFEAGDIPAIGDWVAANETTHKVVLAVGAKDPLSNRGPAFWYNIDPKIVEELEVQFADSQRGVISDFPADTLLGMAQAVTRKADYQPKMLEYLTHSARRGYSPARAVYAQIVEAHGQVPEFDSATLDEWALQALSDGYLFSPGREGLTPEAIAQAKQTFRDRGGYCMDAFLNTPGILEAAKDPARSLDWQAKNGVFIDPLGNTMLHVAATIGCLDTVRALVERESIPVNQENDNKETALYKACQAGHVQVIHYLLDEGASAAVQAKSDKLTALHWIFTAADSDLQDVAQRLVKDGGADINAKVEPPLVARSDFPRTIIIPHFPFELPHGTPLHWACFARNEVAIAALLNLGANIDATYHNFDDSTTPLALAAHRSDRRIVEFLLSRGANAKVRDAKDRNLLHLMSFYVPDRHGSVLQQWNYWIRHGSWDTHVREASAVARMLLDAGAELEAKHSVRPVSTPIITAASLGVWNGGVISALLGLGADVNGARGASSDSVLHTWASVIGSRIAYPASYMDVFTNIVEHTRDVDLRNEFDEDTPLHMVATIEHPAPEFEQACRALLSADPPANINAKNRKGLTPLFIAAGTKVDPRGRALYIAGQGADLTLTTKQGQDVFAQITANPYLSDTQSCEMIIEVLERIDASDTKRAFQDTFLLHYIGGTKKDGSGASHHPHALWNAAMYGRLKTLTLLLDMGVGSVINSLDPTREITALDHALDVGELSRREFMLLSSRYKPGPARRRAEKEEKVYDRRQGPGNRGAEAYWSLPAVIMLLRSRGAKRKCELERELQISGGDEANDTPCNGEYIAQPGVWDLEGIYLAGYSPETQPHRQHWAPVYDSATYAKGWMQDSLRLLSDWYKDGIYWPQVELLDTYEGLAEALATTHLDDDGGQNAGGEKDKGEGEDSYKGEGKEAGEDRAQAQAQTTTVWIRAQKAGESVEVEVVDGKPTGQTRMANDDGF